MTTFQDFAAAFVAFFVKHGVLVTQQIFFMFAWQGLPAYNFTIPCTEVPTYLRTVVSTIEFSLAFHQANKLFWINMTLNYLFVTAFGDYFQHRVRT